MSVAGGLCTNRAEGFGPLSSITRHLPTQCFFDTVLVPAPAVLYLLSLPVLFALTPRPSRRSYQKHTPRSSHSSYAPSLPNRLATHWRRYLALGAYYFLIAVVLLMESIEIARLALARLGVGLVPLVYAGCIAAIALQATDGAGGRLRWSWIAATAFWAAGAVVTAVKIAAVAEFGFTGRMARLGTAYPIVDQFTDLVVLGAFYVLLVGGEVGIALLRRKWRAAERWHDDGVELRSEFDWK